MDRSERIEKRRGLPCDLATRVKGISDAIRDENQSIRYDKVLAARMRISSGYYNSGHVLHVIASCLLGEDDGR